MVCFIGLLCFCGIFQTFKEILDSPESNTCTMLGAESPSVYNNTGPSGPVGSWALSVGSSVRWSGDQAEGLHAVGSPDGRTGGRVVGWRGEEGVGGQAIGRWVPGCCVDPRVNTA